MIPYLSGFFVAMVGIWAVLAWNPVTCVVPATGCASPLPGQTSVCVPPIPSCTHQYVPLRIGVAFLGLGVGIALLVLAWRRDRARVGA
jgi:hypothetical protein